MRTVKRILALTLLSALFACSQPAPAAVTARVDSGRWLMYQRSADHNPVLTKSTPISQWQFDAGARINGGLAIVGTMLLLDTFGHELIALDVRNGTVRWRVKADNILMSTPIVADGFVYVGSGDNGRLAGGDGPATYAATYDLGHAAQVNPVWGRPEGDAMMAFDLATGERRWTYRTVGEDMPSPTLVGDTLVFANGDLHTYGLNARTGEQRWAHTVDGLATMASATADAGNALVSICNDAPYRCQTLATDPSSGKIAWQAPYGNSDSSPTVGDGRVYVSGIVNSPQQALHLGYGLIAALDAKTGRAIWAYRTPQPGPNTEVGSSERAIAGTFANGTYYQAIPTHDELLAFDAASGRIRWRFSSAAPIKMSPIITDGKLYVGDTAGILYTLNASTGELEESRLFKKPFTTSPPIAIGRTLIVANDSVVYALPIR